jgi:hypothetical protein
MSGDSILVYTTETAVEVAANTIRADMLTAATRVREQADADE